MSHPPGRYGPPPGGASYSAGPQYSGQPDVKPAVAGYGQGYEDAPQAAPARDPYAGGYQGSAGPGPPAGYAQGGYPQAENGHGDAYAVPGQKRGREDDYGANKRYAPDPQFAGESETVYRLLIDAKKVGMVIGQAGATINQIKDQTGARLHCIQEVPFGCEEKVFVISSPATRLPGQEFNAAQLALFELFERSIACDRDGHAPPQGPHFRMLICQTQAGSLIGKSGVIIKEMKDRSGCTHIKVLQPEDVPACGLANDKLMHVTGSVDSLRTVLRIASERLRDNPPKELPAPEPAMNALPGRGPPPGMGPPGGPGGPPGPMAGGYRGPPPHGGQPVGGPPGGFRGPPPMGGPPMRPY